MRDVVKKFNGLGVPIRYTFTNPMLEKEHLSDEYCNFCLQIADNGMNEVTVFSPLLEEYIRKNYPSYKIVSSTCKELRTIEEVNAELEKDYKMVVLDYNWNNRFEELDKIKPEYRDRCEILVNAACIPDCKRRGEHYRTIGLNSINCCNAMKNHTTYEPIPFECKYGSDNVIFTIQDYSTYVKPDDVYGKYAEMGFKHFKIEGRTGPIFGNMESYLHYMAPPETRDETRLALLFRMEDNGVVAVRR
jgi:collagenase-like PrtC family protease